jgi:hypothetical protein
MAKKPVKEAGTALIFATVFFVLTTIAFGVMWYMEFAERDKSKADVDKANKDVVAARGQATDAQLETQAYKLYFGVGSDDDRKAALNWSDKDKKRVGEVLNKVKKDVTEAVAKGDPTKMPPELKLWDTSEAGIPNEVPAQSPLAVIGTLVTDRDAAITKETATSKLYDDFTKAMRKQADDYKAATKKFNDTADNLPKDFTTKLNAEIAKYEQRKKDFTLNEKKSRDEIDALNDEKGKLERDATKNKDQIAALQQKVNDFIAMMARAQQQETFINDEPQGKITRRLPEGVVEINIGSDALVRPGLTFTVLPNDFPEKGRQSRIRIMRVPDERGNYKNVERFVEKATLEVLEVLGPKLSRCRITQEFDPIRDGASPGDLLYNSVWRKGQADHIALIGIFDVNGDGSDDIAGVIRDLTHMGIPVDAYFDMKQRKWVGQITEQTRYVVEGWKPVQGAVDPNIADKTALLTAMNLAVKSAREKGVAIVGFRDFFPRIGYRVKLDVTPDRINQATAPYLNKVTAVDTPPVKE